MHSCTHGCRHTSHELEHDSLTIICIKVKIWNVYMYLHEQIHVKHSEKKNNTMISLEGDFRVKFLESSRDSPWVWILVFVVQRLDFLLFLLLAEFRGVAEAEKFWGKLDQPLWVNGRDFSHVFLGCQNELMVDYPENWNDMASLFNNWKTYIMKLNWKRWQPNCLNACMTNTYLYPLVYIIQIFWQGFNSLLSKIMDDSQ